jgi:hypothetical protein
MGKRMHHDADNVQVGTLCCKINLNEVHNEIYIKTNKKSWPCYILHDHY